MPTETCARVASSRTVHPLISRASRIWVPNVIHNLLGTGDISLSLNELALIRELSVRSRRFLARIGVPNAQLFDACEKSGRSGRPPPSEAHNWMPRRSLCVKFGRRGAVRRRLARPRSERPFAEPTLRFSVPCRSSARRPRLGPDEISVRVRPPIAEELPRLPHFLDLVEVHLADHQFLVVC